MCSIPFSGEQLKKLAFIDANSCLVTDKDGKRFIESSASAVIIPTAKELVSLLQDYGYTVVALSNEAGCSPSPLNGVVHRDIKDMSAQFKWMCEQLDLDAAVFCPDWSGNAAVGWYKTKSQGLVRLVHQRQGVYGFRKPGTGMVRLFVHTCLEQACIYVGGRRDDIAVAKAMGMTHRFDLPSVKQWLKYRLHFEQSTRSRKL